MITLSLNFDNVLGGNTNKSHEKKIRELVDTHLTFPGSDKLKLGFNFKENGSTAVSFTGPEEALSEAKRLWTENVKPAADKVRTAVAEANKKAQTAAKNAKTKAVKSVRKAPKKSSAKVKATKTKSTKKAPARSVTAQAKVAKKVVKKKR